MSSAGHILDMIKRIRQNKSLRPSNRQKFQADNRQAIYSGIQGIEKSFFPVFSATKVKTVIDGIRKDARENNRREYLLLILCIIIIALIFFIVI